MPFHLIAFTPFIVLAGTAIWVAAFSLVLRLKAGRVAAALPAARYSAQILAFPVPQASPAVPPGQSQRKTRYATAKTG